MQNGALGAFGDSKEIVERYLTPPQIAAGETQGRP
jgi:hypothetical protein